MIIFIRLRLRRRCVTNLTAKDGALVKLIINLFYNPARDLITYFHFEANFFEHDHVFQLILRHICNNHTCFIFSREKKPSAFAAMLRLIRAERNLDQSVRFYNSAVAMMVLFLKDCSIEVQHLALQGSENFNTSMC